MIRATEDINRREMTTLRLDQPVTGSARIVTVGAARGRAMSAMVEMPARQSLRPVITSASYQSIPQPCNRIVKRRSTEVSGASSRSYRRRRSRRKKSALVGMLRFYYNLCKRCRMCHLLNAGTSK